MKYNHVFFDLDRTLWDFEKNTIVTLTEIYNEFSLRLYFSSFYEFYSIYQEINDKQWELYRQNKITKDSLRGNRFFLTLKEVGIENKELAEEIGIEYIERTPSKTAVFPHTIEVLEYLYKKYPLYILTNGFKEVQIKKIINCNLKKYFKEIITSEDAGYQKPNPLFFEYVFTIVKANPSECIMIGDDLKVDIEGAHNYGIDTVFFSPDKQINTKPAKYVINSLDSLFNIL